MSSALQSVLTSVQENNYITLALITVIAYDYALTLSNEIKYIWRKPWTWVSSMFILVRYIGVCNIVTISLLGSSFVPGPDKLYVSSFHCKSIFIFNGWTFVLFFAAAEFVAVLRVWAMYNQSKMVLIVLLVLFSLEIIFTLIGPIVTSNPKHLTVITLQAPGLSTCTVIPPTPLWTNIAGIFQITTGAVLCILAIVQFVRQSLQMYHVTKQWQLNRYMNLLIQQGILYFLGIFLFSLLDLLSTLGRIPITGWQLILLGIVEFVPIYTLTPRFIISIRELYAKDVEGRQGGGIDTGFGLSSTDNVAGGTAIAFADVEQNERVEDIEEVPMEGGTPD